MNGDDLFGLMAALGWLVDLPSFAPRTDHLVHIVTSAILPNRLSSDAKKATC
ncbi:transcriptional regulator, tetR family domain protein [Collimonas pratensis]|uniref:Transcriptional regulator, tetR family domain protein n=2 Tax=Collimonas pratensis TaxID=279113 RepID=A0A127QX55_9BURK|nr:transcriptional regulator, tetR family domain protein [Collimonas pratensis]AMP14658.1 transcriptional regulator, tetR family domain protein [Collimonas pratensis]